MQRLPDSLNHRNDRVELQLLLQNQIEFLVGERENMLMHDPSKTFEGDQRTLEESIYLVWLLHETE